MDYNPQPCCCCASAIAILMSEGVFFFTFEITAEQSACEQGSGKSHDAVRIYLSTPFGAALAAIEWSTVMQFKKVGTGFAHAHWVLTGLSYQRKHSLGMPLACVHLCSCFQDTMAVLSNMSNFPQMADTSASAANWMQCPGQNCLRDCNRVQAAVGMSVA